ncbi:hypothetical protein LN650_01755 [Klebsiella pneumoniae subsp. pneumoniae]|nr:hypothetical protein [Klebsiella pneumoniae subsp. pneumoniae]
MREQDEKIRYATACWAGGRGPGGIAYGMRSIGGVLELGGLYGKSIRRTPGCLTTPTRRRLWRKPLVRLRPERQNPQHLRYADRH